MFEFNQRMLTYIAVEIYSCKYGTFMCDNQRERNKYNIRDKTVSMWTFINHHSQDLFKNPFYHVYSEAQPIREYPRIARIPTTLYQDLTVWKDLFLRYSLDNPRYTMQIQQSV